MTNYIYVQYVFIYVARVITIWWNAFK